MRQVSQRIFTSDSAGLSNFAHRLVEKLVGPVNFRLERCRTGRTGRTLSDIWETLIPNRHRNQEPVAAKTARLF